MAVASATATIVMASNLLSVRWDHSRLVATHLVTHGIVVVAMEASATASRWEGRPSTAASTTISISATTTLVAALVLRLGLLDIDAPAVNLSHGVILDKILSDRLVSEGHEAETTGRPSVDVFENNCVMNFTKLHKVLLKFLARQFEIESTDEDLALWIRELHGILWVIASSHTVLLNDLDVWVGLLDLLPIVSHHKVVVLVVAATTTSIVASLVILATTTATHLTTVASTLMIVS